MTQTAESSAENYPKVSPETSEADVQNALPFKRVHVIVNPAAGQDKPILRMMNKAFQDAGVDWDISLTKQADDGYRFAQNAAASDIDVVGGDGTWRKSPMV